MKVNLSGVEVKNFECVPAGRYKLRITDGELREAGPNAKNPGSEYIHWELTVAEGPCEGRKMWTNSALLENSLWRLVQLLQATGRFTEEQLAGELDFEIDQCIGAEVVADVKIKKSDEYDDQNDIKKFLPSDTAVPATAGAKSSLLP